MSPLHYSQILEQMSGQISHVSSAGIVSASCLNGKLFGSYKTPMFFVNRELSCGEITGTKIFLAVIQNGNDVDLLRESVRAAIRLGAEEILLIGSGRLKIECANVDGCVITDHVNLSGKNPLIGKNDDSFGPRFPDMSDLYHPSLQKRLRTVAALNGMNVIEGALLILKGEMAHSQLEKRIIVQEEIADLSKEIYAGAITAKHAGKRTAAIAFCKKFSAAKILQLVQHFFIPE